MKNIKQIMGIIILITLVPFTVSATTAEDFTQEEKEQIIERSNLDYLSLSNENLERHFNYSPRTVAPSTSDEKYYSSKNPYYKAGMGMPNCTTYAYGRFWEVYEDEPGISLKNAHHPTTIYWHAKNDSDSIYKNHVGQVPGLGAMAVWSTIQNDNPSAGYSEGHVAIVEEISSNGDINTSNSGHPNTLFYMKTYYKSNNYNYVSNGKTYYFQGFVYQPRFHFILY